MVIGTIMIIITIGILTIGDITITIMDIHSIIGITRITITTDRIFIIKNHKHRHRILIAEGISKNPY